jgi:hypothetical protein
MCDVLLPQGVNQTPVIYIYIYIYIGGGETAKRSTGMATIREKEKRQTLTYLGGGD